MSKRSGSTKSKKGQKVFRKPRVIPEDEFSYSCEWGECEETITDMSQFVKHISVHIAEYVSTAELEIQDNATCFSCNWKECGSQIMGNICDFNRHVYFHAFHVRLKCLGRALCESVGNTDGCTLDGLSRNWIPELPENLICGWKDCEIVYDNPVYFYSHVNQHCDDCGEGNNPEGGAKCRWAGCDTVVRNRYKLREHVRSHSQEKVVACPTCGGLFSNRTKFLDHQKRQAETTKLLYQCSHCNKRFATARILRDHMRHHVNHYKCPFCDMTCPSPSGLRSHIRYRHSQDKPYKCPHCSHGSKSSNDLRRHMEGHNENSIFRCQEGDCNFESRTYVSLTHHMLKVHQNQNAKLKYACHICDTKVSRGNYLTRHLKTKHKFKWPSGHTRFRYKLHDDGYWRLQTVRYESIEVTDHYVGNSGNSSPTPSNSHQDDMESETMETDTMETDTELGMEIVNDKSNYNLDLLGKVALQDSRSNDVLETIAESDIGHMDELYQENIENLGMDRHHVSQVPSSHTLPLSNSQVINQSGASLDEASNQLIVFDQSGSVIETLSVTNHPITTSSCLDMPVLYSGPSVSS